IAAATAAHPELTLLSVTAGLPTFCEKPVARTPAEAAQLARQLAGTGVEIQIGFPRRFDVAFAAARAAAAGGEPGGGHTGRSPSPAGRPRVASSAGSTPSGRPRWTGRPRRGPTSRRPAGSSTTAPSTTSTPSGG